MARQLNLQAREHILETAHRLFHERGFRGTSMDDIADAAGLKKANVFYYYPSKEDLALAAIEKAINCQKEILRSQLPANGRDPIRAIEELFSNYASNMEKTKCFKGCFLGNMAQELSDHHEKVREKVSAYFQFWTQELAKFLSKAKASKYFKETMDPSQAAGSLISLIEGATLMCKTQKNVSALHDAKTMAVSYLRTLKT